MKQTLQFSFVYQGQRLPHFWEERSWDSKKLKVPWGVGGWPISRTSSPPGQGATCTRCRAAGSKGSTWETTRKRGRRRETQDHHQRKGKLKMLQPCLSEQVAVKVLCFPLLVKLQDYYFFKCKFAFCWRFSSGGVRPSITVCLWTLLRSLIFFPNLPLLLSWALPYSQPCLMLLTSAELGMNRNY